jgi:ketol-acid reductoisomerase
MKEATVQNILILGFGAQAKAWAMNLKDSGKLATIALRKNSESIPLVRSMGFPLIFLEDKNYSSYNWILNLTSDDAHSELLELYASHFPAQAKVVYAHGFSLLKFELAEKYPHLHHLLLAPKAIASELRFKYETKGALAAAMSLEKCHNLSPAGLELVKIELQNLAQNIGITKIVECKIVEETYADLFSEQSLLCSLIPYSALYSFNHLVKKGIPKDLAYLECWVEMKLIIDALMKHGPEKFFSLISPNALIGGELGREVLLGEEYQKGLDKLLENIWSKDFFKQIDQQNITEMKNQVQAFWKKEPLNEIYQDWGKSFI